ncbi:MAG: KH domain-containing protein, partial [Nitrosopumilaceae archaeon]|nr:KH domain-containing protein [Nitrosopumilaceae archaeon]
EFAGKSPSQVERIKGRIIGEGGKARKNMENLSGTSISVYGRTVAIIGDVTKLKIAVDAISSLSSGSMHGSVYNKLESARRREKADKMRLWEDQDVF